MASTLTPAAYAEHVGASERSVRRWLADGELPAAELVARRWEIPADAVRVQRLPEAVADVSRDAVAPRAPRPATTLVGALETLPIYVDVDTAAQLLGISPYAVRRHADELGGRRWGLNGALVIPQSALRELAGL
ncbi:hypothetical protein Cch01nite_24830 [Cellulomonas chitinilytica]|uniref:Helix-turn-helix domain-containing protein n=1 Tax=Cellulomonas chitinilytica TaxID=398759 RepID=A0A919U338_9CELL|nr:hypothetical protein [Cellulomonas chitinilytica]GIG21759.1 hypothetical protein Cch01nite_24830 [Cellulomonas chitinilytica]